MLVLVLICLRSPKELPRGAGSNEQRKHTHQLPTIFGLQTDVVADLALSSLANTVAHRCQLTSLQMKACCCLPPWFVQCALILMTWVTYRVPLGPCVNYRTFEEAEQILRDLSLCDGRSSEGCAQMLALQILPRIKKSPRTQSHRDKSLKTTNLGPALTVCDFP